MNKKYIISIGVVLVAVFYFQTKENSLVKSKSSTDINSSISKEKNEANLGIIEYNVSTIGDGVFIHGSKVLYFKNTSNLTLIETNLMKQINGKSEKESKLEKYENGFTYLVDDKQKVIIKRDFAGESLGIEQVEMANMSKEFIIKFDGKKLGVESILGYQCELWEVREQDSTLQMCLYKNIPLKKISITQGLKSEEIAKNINFDANIPDFKFELPKYPIVTSEKMMNYN